MTVVWLLLGACFVGLVWLAVCEKREQEQPEPSGRPGGRHRGERRAREAGLRAAWRAFAADEARQGRRS